MVRHCGWLLTRFQVKPSARTAFSSNYGREYKRGVLEFPEQTLYHVAESTGTVPLVGKLMPRWLLGVWVGKTEQAAEHLLLTVEGVKKARSVRRVTEDCRWKPGVLELVKGLPWDPAETGKHALDEPSPTLTATSKRMYITRAMVIEKGPTPGCSGCAGTERAHS
jgi:hypothetical protein